MKFCQRHWDLLRSAIVERGLDHLLAKTGEEVVARTVAAIEHPERERSTFDPLMNAMWLLVNKVADVFGPQGMLLLIQDESDGSDRCPLCFLQVEHDKACQNPRCQSFDLWCGYAADDMLQEAKRLGLILTDSPPAGAA